MPLFDEDSNEIVVKQNEISEEEFLNDFAKNVKERLQTDYQENEPEQISGVQKIEFKTKKERYDNAKFLVKQLNNVIVLACEIISDSSDEEFKMDNDELKSYSEILADYMDLKQSDIIKPEFIIVIGFVILLFKKLRKAFQIRKKNKQAEQIAEKIRQLEEIEEQAKEQIKEQNQIENAN